MGWIDAINTYNFGTAEEMESLDPLFSYSMLSCEMISLALCAEGIHNFDIDLAHLYLGADSLVRVGRMIADSTSDYVRVREGIVGSMKQFWRKNAPHKDLEESVSVQDICRISEADETMIQVDYEHIGWTDTYGPFCDSTIDKALVGYSGDRYEAPERRFVLGIEKCLLNP